VDNIINNEPSAGSKWVIGFLAALAAFAFCLHTFSHNKADVDLWGNVGFVKSLPCAEGFARTNTFSYTEPDSEWINHEWLAEYIFNRAFVKAGNTGLLIVKIFLGMGVVILLYSDMRRSCTSMATSYLYLLLIVSTMGYGFSTRPHHFTYLLYAGMLWWFKKDGKNALFLLLVLPAIMIIWANLHGAFFIGLLVLLVMLIGAGIEACAYRDRSRLTQLLKLLLATGASFAASLVNPYGVRLWQFVAQSAGKFRPYLSEWAPFSFRDHSAEHPDFIMLTAISIVCVLVTKKRRKTCCWTLSNGSIK